LEGGRGTGQNLH